MIAVMQKSLLFLLVLVAVARSADVHIDNGVVTGSSLTIDGRQVWQFLGIPFAEPPVGELRFRRPQPLTRKWSKPLIADTPPKGCLQPPFPFLKWDESEKPSYGEDCLYLDVWTPSLDKSKKKSVMVWIHGGGYVFGEGLPMYNGKALAAIGDVIVVTIQYRLGFMGFARFDSELVPGNNALWDQQLAMKWVHDNIAAFGGDPASVTIFGESAGSASVAHHLMNADSSRYFKRAILQSGSALNPWGFNPNSNAMEIFYRDGASKHLGCDQTNIEELLRCLQGKSEAEMLEAIKKLAPNYIKGPILGPILDGYFISRTPKEMMKAGDVQKKDIIIGVTDQEGSEFANMVASYWVMSDNKTVPTADDLNETFIDYAVDTLAHYYPYYPDKPSPAVKEMIRLRSLSHVDPRNGDLNIVRFSEVLGEFAIYCGVNAFADQYRKVHETVYFYEFAHKPWRTLFWEIPPDWMKCAHGNEIPFVFALSLVYPNYDRVMMTQDEVLLARRVIADFTTFAKTGAPRDPNWRPFSLDKKEFYRYAISSTLQTGGIKRNECVFWDRVLPMVNSIGTSAPTNGKGGRARSDEL